MCENARKRKSLVRRTLFKGDKNYQGVTIDKAQRCALLVILIVSFLEASVTPLRSRGLRTLPIFREDAVKEIKTLIRIEKTTPHSQST